MQDVLRASECEELAFFSLHKEEAARYSPQDCSNSEPRARGLMSPGGVQWQYLQPSSSGVREVLQKTVKWQAA